MGTNQIRPRALEETINLKSGLLDLQLDVYDILTAKHGCVEISGIPFGEIKQARLAFIGGTPMNICILTSKKASIHCPQCGFYREIVWYPTITFQEILAQLESSTQSS